MFVVIVIYIIFNCFCKFFISKIVTIIFCSFENVSKSFVGPLLVYFYLREIYFALYLLFIVFMKGTFCILITPSAIGGEDIYSEFFNGFLESIKN